MLVNVASARNTVNTNTSGTARQAVLPRWVRWVNCLPDGRERVPYSALAIPLRLAVATAF